MGEEFQVGVCGGTWWNPSHSLFSGGFGSPCSVTQLGGGGSFDMGCFGWSNEAVIKGGKSNNNNNNNNNQVFDNLVVFPDQMDSSLDIFGFGLSPTSSTTDWNPQNFICNNGSSNEGSFDAFLQDNMSNSRLYSSYEMGASSPNMMMTINSSNFSYNNNSNNIQDASPPMAMAASSNSSGDSSTITCDGGLATSFPMNSSASYLIQSLFDDSDDQSHHQFINNPSSYGSMDSSGEIMSSNSWINTSVDHNPPPPPQLQVLQSNKLNGGMNAMMSNNNGNHGQISSQFSPSTLDSIRVSMLNSLQSRSRGPNSFNQKSQSCATTPSNKVNTEEIRRESKNNTSNSDQPPAKRARIETPSPLPTFKVRKEKLGDRITALQQLVSPFGKTDTASVLHEAIEYIKFLHDQVHVLSTPYLKNGNGMPQQQQQQQGSGEKSDDNEESKKELVNKGLCLVPISSTYPVAQETPVDFWTPTFGGNAFR